MGHRWGKLSTEWALKNKKNPLIVAMEQKQANLKKTAQNAWKKTRSFKMGLKFKARRRVHRQESILVLSFVRLAVWFARSTFEAV